MYRTNFIKYTFVVLTAFLIASCEDEPEEQTITEFSGIRLTSNGNVNINFSEMFGNTPLKLAPDSFNTASGDTVKITDLKYYVSHVTFTRADGSQFNTQNHKLIDFGNVNNAIVLPLAAGNYTKVSFLLGVDSLNNHSGMQEGDLDPSYGLFWGWNTGYIFYRIKGRYGAAQSAYAYDIGGVANLLKIEVDLSGVKVEKNNPTILLKHDVSKFFNAPNAVTLRNVSSQIHTANDPLIPTFTANMKGMFSLISVQ